MVDKDRYVILEAKEATLILDCAVGERASILHWGARLNVPEPEQIKAMTRRQHAPGGPDAEIEFSLLNETGTGVAAHAGFQAHRDGAHWATVFDVSEVRQDDPQSVEIVCEDQRTAVRVRHVFSLDAVSGVLSCRAIFENLGTDTLAIHAAAAVCVPLDQRMTRLLGFTGRWSNEFQLQAIPSFAGSYVRDNKAGRTSHDSFPGLIAADELTCEQSGTCFGYHLGWSGNHRVSVDRLSDGRATVQLRELFFPGELSLAPGAQYETPVLYAAYSARGLSALSRNFHQHLTGSVMDGRIKRKPRPVHYNTWEAVYFDHDARKLFELAERAAAVGAERFILDDGWFGGRRNDRAGLGDWFVSEEVYPDGVQPLIEHVTGLGLEFGLWFEPEMVNPDSDLYRDHPDWVLQAEGVAQISARGQFVLDLTRPEVSAYLYERLHHVLSDHAISYVKWDMNRDLHHPGSAGRPVTSQQTRAAYALIDRLRAAHPDLEIESCASGGGRADYGVLQRTDRIWTSDNNDALDRQTIQRGASHFFPLEVLGAHVGPAKCHITGRRLSMNLRVATALFGHMGMELNLLEESDRDLETLKSGIALYKRYRNLLHAGAFHRVDTPDHVNAVGVIAPDRSEALFSWANLTGHRETLPGRFFVPGLDPDRRYRTQIVWPAPLRSVSSPSVIDRLELGGDGAILSGEALAEIGLQVPLLHPETCLIYRFEAT